MLEGNVDNGTRGELVSTFYTGPAGARDRGEGRLELAFTGKPPRTFKPEDATFDGKPIHITAAKASTVRGMVLVEAREVAEA
jgi:hypothetical protein